MPPPSFSPNYDAKRGGSYNRASTVHVLQEKNCVSSPLAFPLTKGKGCYLTECVQHDIAISIHDVVTTGPFIVGEEADCF